MTYLCRAASCASGYRISGSSCILDTKCYSARFGSKCYSSASIYSSTQLEGLRPDNKIKGYQYDSTWLRVTGYTSVGGSTYNSITCYMQYSNLNLIGDC